MSVYWVWFAELRGISLHKKRQLLDDFRDPEELYLTEPAALPADVAEALQEKDLTAAEMICSRCARKDIGILPFTDAAYPEKLRNIEDPPMVLYWKGKLPDWKTQPIISVVGTRKASPYGLHTARLLGGHIAACGGLVVSGAASGIDTAAMRGALDADRPTIGVLGGGVDVVYPASNRGLYHDVEQYGCLISEYPPGTQTIGVHFPVRNRIISGLSLGVLVVEAPEKSGALITASRALDQGRDVFAVPANVDVYSCRGNLKLLREGAIVARDAWDVLQEYAALYPKQLHRASAISFLPEKQQPKPEPVRPQATAVQSSPPAELPQTAPPPGPAPGKVLSPEKLERLSPDERVIVQALEPGVLHIDELVNQTKLPAGRVLASLTLLEVKGIVRRQPGKRFALA